METTGGNEQVGKEQREGNDELGVGDKALENHRLERNQERGGDGRAMSDSGSPHSRKCSVCANPRREEIERDFLAWRSPQEIVREYKLGHRRAVYRHAHALGLMDKRYANLRAALGRIIERAGDVPVTAWAVVAAVRACAKINARGQWVEQGESSDLRELLDGMTHEELLAYAQDGALPDWFGGTRVATVPTLEVQAGEGRTQEISDE